jgi:hypothetical protein
MQFGKGSRDILVDQCGVLTMALSQCGHTFGKKHGLPQVNFVFQVSMCCYSGLVELLL